MKEALALYPPLPPRGVEVRVGLDIDDVLCNFNEGLLRAAKRLGMADRFPDHWNWITEWLTGDAFETVFSAVKEVPEFWLDLKPFVGVQQTINFPVAAYVTKRPIRSAITALWLEKHNFPYAPVFTVGRDATKSPVLHENAIRLYVDDHVANFEEINGAGIPCFLRDRPWNRKHDDKGRRIKSLSEVGDLIAGKVA